MKPIYFFIPFLAFLSCQNAEKQPDVAQKNESDSKAIFRELGSGDTNLNFMNTVVETETENYDNYVFIYNGSGVAVGDINNDGLADIYFCGNSAKDKLFINKGNMKFEDISESSGISKFDGWSMGSMMVDINADGWLDIYVCRSGPSPDVERRTNRLFINNQDGTFTETAADYGLNSTDYSIQAAFFDYDLDGDLDMYLLNHPEKKREKGLSFKQHQENVRLGKSTTDVFYENIDGRFEDRSKEANTFAYGYRHGIAVGDIDNNGYPDLYISSDFDDPDILFMNRGNKTFVNTIDNSFRHISFNSMGNELIDINNDGLLDLYVVDMAPSDHFRSKAFMMSMDVPKFRNMVANGLHHQYMFNTYQLNNGNGTFSEIGQLSKTAKTDWSWAPLFFDMDHDGYRDLFISNGIKENYLYRDIDVDAEERYGANHQLSLDEYLDVVPSDITENIFYKNKNGVAFEKKNSKWAPKSMYNSNGVATADFDNDGDLDLVMNNMDATAVIYESLASDNEVGNSVKVVIKGKDNNTQALGTKVEIVAGDLKLYQELYTSRGYLSCVDGPMVFGLADKEKVDIRVTWPDGSFSEIKDAAVNETHELAYGQNSVASLGNDVSEAQWISRSKINGLQFRHKEDKFDDYDEQILLPHSQSNTGPALTKADVNGDGLEDMFVCGAAGQPGVLFIQENDGGFRGVVSAWKAHQAAEDAGAVFFDADGDNDMDLYVVSGGAQKEEGHMFYQDRLYINEGNEKFVYDPSRIPQIRVSGKTVLASDVDNDGDTDLFVGGRLIPNGYPQAPSSFILQNEGGKFVPNQLDINQMVASAVFSDYDGDGDDDLITVGEWSPVMIFNNDNGNFTKADLPDLNETTGLWFSIKETDLDNDGDKDYLVGNLGVNAKFKVDKDHEFHIYGNDFDSNGTYDIVLSSNYKGRLVPSRGRECSSQQMPFIKDKFKDFKSFASASLEDIYGENLNQALHYQANTLASVMLINNGNGSFEMTELPWNAQRAPVTDFEVVDINKDGVDEILCVGNLFNVEVETQRYDASVGAVLQYQDGEIISKGFDETGFFTTGDARDILLLDTPNGKILVVSNNNGLLDTFRLGMTDSSGIASN